MRKVVLHIIICLAIALQANAQVKVENGFISNQLYVKIIPPVAEASEVQYIPHPDNPEMGKTAWDIIKRFGGQSMVNAFSTPYKDLQNIYKVTIKDGYDVDALINELTLSGGVEYAERIPVYTIDAKPLDLDESKQWYFNTINMNSSWSVQPNAERTKVIAVIDNGVLFDHEDLVNSFAPNYKETAGDGDDRDKNGYIDDFLGWNVVDNNANIKPHNIPDHIRNNNPNFRTFGWHGTHVAGIIAATNNNEGIASLGVNNRIIGIKASGMVNGQLNDHKLFNINEAFRYAIDRKVDIINCSFGSPSQSIVTQTIINEAVSKGIIVIAAAGNFNNDKPYYPAAYDNVIAVGATTKDDKVWKANQYYGSNYGSYIDVMAPGHEIYSTVSTTGKSYDYLSGTSMAAPIVSGIVGLMLSNEPDLADRMEEILKAGCDNIDALNPNYVGKMGAGRVNVDKSFDYLITIDQQTSVVEAPKYTQVNVYPNPSVNQFYIPFNQVSENGQPVELKIFNMVGAQVAQQTVDYQNQPISVNELSQGMYQVVVTNSLGKDFRARLVVNR